MHARSILLPGVVAILVATVAIISREGTGTSSTAKAVSLTASAGTVAIKGYVFSPAKVAVRVGTTITFTNSDSTAHTATADNGSAFDSGSLNQGQSRRIVFSRAGTFTYHCLFHAFMTGTITVS